MGARMISKASLRRSRRFPRWFILVLPATLWVGYHELRSSPPHPQAIFVLGGEPKREDFAAAFARQHPDLPVWVSGGSNPEYTDWVFSSAGIDLNRVHIDRTALDTVTNFTSLADQLKANGITSVYLVTSDYHMQRAKVIGDVVFGSRGIALEPVPVPSQQAAEPLQKTLRDGARAVLWVATGQTGADLRHPAQAE
jgi:uncharacterized SAM-binding protein YcdF (DUF218 family)